MTASDRERLEELTLRFVDGDLTDAEAAELEQRLADEDAAALHSLLLEQEAVLRGEQADVDIVARTVSEIESGKRVEKSVLLEIARPSRLFRLAAAAIFVLAVGFGGSAAWVASWAASPQEALVFAMSAIEPGANANMKALVRHAQTLLPEKRIGVRFSLLSDDRSEVWAADAMTDDHGVAQVADALPQDIAEGRYALKVVAEGAPTVMRSVVVKRHYRIYVSTGKPRYQPGHTINVRALAMTAQGQLPADGRELVFEIRDPKGNLVHRRATKTSSFGLASTSLELAEQVNVGAYRIQAAIGDVASGRRVVVDRYVLPKIKIDAGTDRSFYGPVMRSLAP